MVRLTDTNGNGVTITAALVIRARGKLTSEGDKRAKTRIDWVQVNFVLEAIEDVSAAISAEAPNFVSLTAKDGRKIWFNAEKSVGPMPLRPSELVNGVRSAIKIMGYRQYVAETPDEVRQLIATHGGTAVE